MPMGPSRFLLQPPQLAHRVDNGADPNETVEINDLLSSTSLPQAEQVSVLEDPELGYGGSRFAGPVPELSTCAIMILGFAVVGLMAFRRKQTDPQFVWPDPR
jgi:hypothetical protein